MTLCPPQTPKLAFLTGYNPPECESTFLLQTILLLSIIV